MNYRIIEETLRDGCHGLRTPFNVDQVALIARELDKEEVYAIDLGLGLGLGTPGTLEYIRAAKKAVKKAKLCTLIVPRAGDLEDISLAAEAGLNMIRIGVICSQTEMSVPYIKKAKELGLETGVFLMVSHSLSPWKLAEKAEIIQMAGADFITIGDSIGAMIEEDIKARVLAMKSRVSLPLGIHAHNSMGLAVANTISALKNGCSMLDVSLEGLGADAGNANFQAVVAVANKNGLFLENDIQKLNKIATKYIRPVMDQSIELNGFEIWNAYKEIFPEVLRPFT